MRMEEQETWIAVVASGHARFFALDQDGAPVMRDSIDDIMLRRPAFPVRLAARPPAGETVCVAGDAGTGPAGRRRKTFLRAVGEILAQHADAGAYCNLILVANRATLVLLRQALPDRVHAMVCGEVPADMSLRLDAEIANLISDIALVPGMHPWQAAG